MEGRVRLGLIIFGLTLLAVRMHALKCYTCSYQFSGTSRDKECVDRPWNVTQGQKEIDCPYPYCVVFRQALKATNTIHSFHRGCEMQGRGNTCVPDSYYSTCSYTCDTDLCNYGDGVPVGSEVGQDVVRPKPMVNPYPRPQPPKTTKPYRPPKYGYGAENGGNGHVHNYNGRNNSPGSNGVSRNENRNENEVDESDGSTLKDKSKKREKTNGKGEKGKNQRRKGDCMHPYACDQSKYWPGNGGTTHHSSTFVQNFFYVSLSLVLAVHLK